MGRVDEGFRQSSGILGVRLVVSHFGFPQTGSLDKRLVEKTILTNLRSPGLGARLSDDPHSRVGIQELFAKLKLDNRAVSHLS